MTNTLREAAQQALDALKLSRPAPCGQGDELMEEECAAHRAAIVALRTALAESERDWSLLGATQQSLREHMAEIQRLRQALEFTAQHKSSDWPERCQQMVDTARTALMSVPNGAEQEPVTKETYLQELLAVMNDYDPARWEIGFRNIVSILIGPRSSFEIADVVEMVRQLQLKQSAEQEPVVFLQFLTDVVTAAGLLSHGKTDKALATRISEFAVHLRTAPQPAKPAKQRHISYVCPQCHWTLQEQEPLTDEEIEQAYREIWRNVPSDFAHTTHDWIEQGIKYAERAHGITGAHP